MTISRYTDNLYRSEVYRELERQAVKKGFFKPTDAELVKLAAQEVQSAESDTTDTSDDLMQDIARLAFAMRRKGFIAQAEDIEQKLVMFKRAENALYNVTPEKNSDFIDFAHRDGDVNLLPGSGDLGTFETMQSISDKIQAVVRKEPTGVNKMAALAALIKSAQNGGISSVSGGDGGGTSQGGAPQGGTAALEAAPQQTSTESQPVSNAPKTRTEILNTTKIALDDFDVARKNLAVLPSVTSFGFDNLAGNQDQRSAYVYFASLAGAAVNVLDLNRYFETLQVGANEGVVQDDQINATMLFNKLTGQYFYTNADFLVNIATALGVNANFMAMFGNQNSPTYIFETLLGGNVGVNKENGWKACLWLQQAFQTTAQRAFGQNNVIFNAAQNASVKIFETLIADLNAINPGEPASDSTTALRQLIRVNNGINTAVAKFTTGESFKNLRMINASTVDQVVLFVKGIGTKISDQYKSIAGSAGMKLVDIDAAILDEALQYWEGQTQSENADQATKAGQIADKITQLQEIIRQYSNRPWVEFQEALSTMKPPIDAPNKNAFLAGLRAIINSSKGRA